MLGRGASKRAQWTSSHRQILGPRQDGRKGRVLIGGSHEGKLKCRKKKHGGESFTKPGRSTHRNYLKGNHLIVENLWGTEGKEKST